MEHWERVQQQRKIDKEILEYRRKRFEEYWQMCEIGLMTRLEMLEKLKEEDEPEDDYPTQPIPVEEIRRKLDGTDRFDVFGTDD